MVYFKHISSFRSQWKKATVDQTLESRRIDRRPTTAQGPRGYFDFAHCTCTRSATPSGVSNVFYSPTRLDRRRAVPLQSCKRVFGNRPNDNGGEGGAVIGLTTECTRYEK